MPRRTDRSGGTTSGSVGRARASRHEHETRQRTTDRSPLNASKLRGALPRWWFGLSIRAKGLTVILIPLTCVIGTTSAGLVLQRRVTHVRSVALLDRNVINSVNQVLSDVVNAETGVRGYAATHDIRFLAPSDLALARISAERAALRGAAVGDLNRPRQQVIDATTVTVLAELTDIRAATRAGARARTLLPDLAAQKTTMDRLRHEVAGMAGAASAHLARQSSTIARLGNDIEILDIAGLVAALMAGLAGVALFTSGIARRVTAAAENAARLGRGVPLEAVDASGDELGRLADALVRAEALLATRAAALTAARDEALQGTRAKNAFLSHTSHELRTPLNSILGFAQLLQFSDLDPDDRDSTERILESGRRLLVLIDELIDIARIESGDLHLAVAPVAVVPLVDEISRLLGPLAAERSIAVEHRFDDAHLGVQADRRRLSQVLMNLVSNAIKYNRSGGTIILSYAADGENVGVVVSDTGPGISAADLDRVFVPFERLRAGASGIEGTGIGLSLARALTEGMGGTLTASSVPGEGSAFTVMLRRAGRDARPPSPPPKPDPRAAPAAIGAPIVRILHVEDDPDNVEMVSRFLRMRANARLRSVPSGRGAIIDAAHHLPDVILLDLRLVDGHGIDVLDEFKAEPKTNAIPVIVLSADATPAVSRRVLTHGAAAFLTKPIELARLGELLDALSAPPAPRAAAVMRTSTTSSGARAAE
jgi:signal transduction histidine kinase/ActR/RegA family two-component response regulator